MQHYSSVRFQCFCDTFFSGYKSLKFLQSKNLCWNWTAISLSTTINMGMSNPPTRSCTLDCTHSKLLFKPIEVHNHKFVIFLGPNLSCQPQQYHQYLWDITYMRIDYYHKIAKSDSVTRTFYPPKYANLKHRDPWKGKQGGPHVSNLSRTHLQCQTGLEVLKITDRQDCIKQIYKS
jgi:hypothetical protein